MSGARSALASLAVAGALALAGAPVQAAREPVLKGVTLPHSYYWRELYLPQLTGGPSAAAFAPNGGALVYSMAGSLWRQTIGSDEAVELTHGPGYDYQPDWSGDGRWIVFARHHRDAIELVALDVERGTEQALTATGHVQVEPRFAPDGERLAFVTTQPGNFAVVVADFAEGRIGAQARLLPEHRSSVNRYYYAPTDHVINPSWAPDGRALLVVTNRDVAWGTGDVWHVPLDDATAATRVLREETSWAARPELAPDGRRLLYSSYHGRQWHQLWLTNRAGESPMPLTFGEFDRRSARWSPDGRRIAYVSNEDGGTALWVQDVVGGARTRIEAARRRWQRPMGILPIRIRDAEGGVLAARVQVLGDDGRHYAPEGARVHADDGYERARQQHEDHYFHCAGDCTLRVPHGEIQVRVQRGLEWQPFEGRVLVLPGAAVYDVVLAPNRLPAEYGAWTSADLHVHMNYGGTYRHEPATLAREAAAEDLDAVFNLVVNKEQRVTDIGSYTTRPFTGDGVTILHGQEHHTSYWGHLGLLGLDDHYLTPDFAAYRHSGFASPYPHDGVIADLAHAQGALVGYVHPYDWAIDPEKEKTLTHQFPADVAHGKVDYFELVSFSDPRANDQVWHRLLNLGFRVPAGAGTDAMANYASLRGPLGVNRSMLPDTPATPQALERAIRDGRGFVTNAPLLGLIVEGASPGDTLTFGAPRRVSWRAAVRSIVPLDRVELLVDGRVVERLKPREGRSGDFDGRIKLARSGWIALRAYARDAHPWIADLYPYGHTNPIWVDVADRPARAPAAAAYFVRWLDRVIDDAGAREDWNEAAERDATLAYLRAARAIFERKANDR